MSSQIIFYDDEDQPPPPQPAASSNWHTSSQPPPSRQHQLQQQPQPTEPSNWRTPGWHPAHRHRQNEPTMQQQQQKQQQQQQEMHEADEESVQPGGRYPMLWPHGVGVTERIADPDDCSCPEPTCWCHHSPIWFTSADLHSPFVSSQERWAPRNGCAPGWEINDGDVLGVPMTFRAVNSCPAFDTCIEPELHIEADGHHVGHVVMKSVLGGCLTCDDIVLQEAKDARGDTQFVVRHPCCGTIAPTAAGAPGWFETATPIFDASLPDHAPPIAHIVHRYHQCFCCRPQWTGLSDMPECLTPDEQALLLGMAVVRLWRLERTKR